MKNTFEQTARFYDIDQHPPDHEDIPFYLEKASQYGSPILELACGTGRVAIPLAHAGFSVTGLDLSREMLSIFKEKSKKLSRETSRKITIHHGEMTNFSLETAFKLILIPFHSFQALTSDEEVRKCLDCIYRHLEQDGALILNVARFDEDIAQIWQDGLETQESVKFLRDGQFVTRYSILRELDQQKRLITFDNLYRVTSSGSQTEDYHDRLQVRYYDANDLRKLLAASGFEIIEEWGGYDGTLLEDGEEMIFVCRKK